jgi:hypothetical protein
VCAHGVHDTHVVEQMIAYMRQKVNEYPTLASLVAIGDKTYEGNVIYMMKVRVCALRCMCGGV